MYISLKKKEQKLLPRADRMNVLMRRLVEMGSMHVAREVVEEEKRWKDQQELSTYIW